ncbi:FAD-binding domain-containing protein [Apiospora aurea]|uniref:FAD-binding domain-containing protein n=1 Tax=Apiospora aurea TaxID=335848 RepID=A0ABR1QW71_9PEZI
MAPLIYILSCCFALVLRLATAFPQATCLDGACEVSRRDLSVGEIAADLGPQLSKTSSVFGDDDPRWENATLRFQALARPSIKLVVQPGEEGDVAIIYSIHDHKPEARPDDERCQVLGYRDRLEPPQGPGLGGGHGRWQGHFGLVSDNFVKLNTVLADGTAITISETSQAGAAVREG